MKSMEAREKDQYLYEKKHREMNLPAASCTLAEPRRGIEAPQLILLHA